MKRTYLERLNGKNNVQVAMSLLSKGLRKYTKVGHKSTTNEYTIYNFWLRVDTKVSVNEYNYICRKLAM